MIYCDTISFIIIYFISACATVKADDVIDFGEDCSNNLKTSFYLTHGMGSVDAVSLLFNNYHKNCSISFHTSNAEDDAKMAQIVVLNILPKHNKAAHICSKSLSHKMQIVGAANIVNVCEALNFERNGYVQMWRTSKITFSIEADSFEGISLVVTSAVVLTSNERCGAPEVHCDGGFLASSSVVCIDRELMCDGNTNCGVVDGYDEDHRLCHSDQNLKRRWLLIACGSGFITLIAGVLMRCVWIYVRKLSPPALMPPPRDLFKKSPQLDNKLVVVAQVTGATHKKISKRAIEVRAVNARVSLNNNHHHQYAANHSGGSFEGMDGSNYLSAVPVVKKRGGKRLPTNSPVFRNPTQRLFSRTNTTTQSTASRDDTTITTTTTNSSTPPTSPIRYPHVNRFHYNI